MPQLALSAASFTASAAPAIAATAAKAGFMATMKSVAVNLLMNAAITAAMSALQPQVGAAGRPGEWLLSPDGPIPFAAGRVGVAGSAVDIDTFGPDLMYKGFVTVLSGAGPIDGFESFRGDDEFVTFDASGKAITSQWKGEMWLKRSLGAQPDFALSPPTGLKNNAVMPGWTASRRLSGKACDMLVLGENSKGTAYPTGEVKPLRVFRGLRVWDPRLDSTYPGGVGPCRLSDPSTWVYSANPGLWAIKWSLGLWEGPVGKGAPQVDRQVGGIGAKASGIEFETLVALANIADANGWTCAAYPTTDDDKSQVLDAFLQAAGAIYAQRAGKISCIQRAAPRTSIVTISVADTAGPLEIDTAASRIDRINTIRPRFWSEPHRWQLTALKEVTAEAYQTEDGGERPRGIDYPYVTNARQAAQLAALQIAHTREGIAGVIPLKPHLQRIRPGDAFTITEPGFVLNGVKCLCLNTEYDPATGVVRVSFVSETDAKYPFAMGQNPTPPVPPVLTPADPTLVSPPLPEDWVIVPRPPAQDGTQVPGFDLTGIVSNDTADAMLVNWREVAVGEDPDVEPVFQDEEGVILPGWNDAGIWPPTTRTLTIQGPQSGSVVWLAIRYKRGNNYSQPVLVGPKTAPTLAGVPVIDTTPPGVPAGLALSSTSTPDAAGNPYVRINATWTANTDEDLNGYEVEVTESGFTIVEGVATNSYGRTALTGRSYAIRVRAVDKAGNRSDWSEPQSITGAGDTTPPAAPTALAVSVSLGSFFLEWTNPSASDLSKIEVWEHTSNASGSATRIATVNAQSGAKGSYARSGMAAGAVRYFWLKAVDTSGNASVFSTGASGTIPNVPAGEIDTTPPGVPSGLSLSTALVTDAGTGLPRPRVVAMWTAPGDADLAGFDVEVTEAGGNPVTRMVSTNRDQWDSRPNVYYQVRVRAFDRVGNRSTWTSSQSITAPADAVAPAAPTALTAVASVGSVFLSGVAPSDLDTAKIEIWENTTNNSGTATRIAVVNAIPGAAWSHPRTGLSANDTRWYWAKAVDTSGNASAFSTGISRTVPYVANPDIAVGTLAGDRLLANSVEGSVFKTNTSLPGTIEVGSTGVTIQTVQSQANDPAARINVQSTKIDPGKITIWGSGSLSDLPDWRMGGDVTRIDGGKIGANTVRTNSVEVGLRGVESSLTFSANDPDPNRVSWTAGTIEYVNSSGTTTSVAMSAGATAVMSSFPQAISFSTTSGALVRSTVAEANADPNRVILAVYYGGTNLVTNYGRTIIDGDIVRTGTLETRHHSSLSITTELLAAGAVTGEKVTANTFEGSVFKTNTSLPGTITVGGTGVTIQTVQSQAANPAATINGGTTRIDPGLITVSGGTTLSSWRHGSDLTKIDGGNVFTNSIKANSVEIGLRGVYFDRFNFTESGGVLTWGTGRATYTGDAGTAVIVDIAAGSHTYTGTGVTYVYWTQGATTLSFTKITAEANGPNAIIIGTFYGAGNFTAGYGRTVINGDQIQTGAVTAIKINVTDLSAISANIGNITAGKVGNAAGTTFFDLTNARQQFQVGSYVWRQGAIGSTVVTWFGPSSVPIGSETRTNGAFATGTDGKTYLGTEPLQNGGNTVIEGPVIRGQNRSFSSASLNNTSTWVSAGSVTLSNVPAGSSLSFQLLDLTGTLSTGTSFVGEARILDGASVVSTSTFSLFEESPGQPLVVTGGFAVGEVSGSGSKTYAVELRRTGVASLEFPSGEWSITTSKFATATNAGMMSPTQAQQLATLVAGGGGGGPPLATTTPASVGASGAIGTGTSAARADHVHAHGNQGGGALHANATPSADGFMSAADKTKLNGIASGATANSSNATLLDRANHTGTQAASTITGLANSATIPATDAAWTAGTLVRRDGNGTSSGYRWSASSSGGAFVIGAREMGVNGAGFGFNVACTGPSFTPTSDIRLKFDFSYVADFDARARLMQIELLEYTRVQDGVRARGFGAQGLREIDPLYVTGDEPVFEPALDEDNQPLLDAEGQPVMTAVLDDQGEQVRTHLGVDPMALIADLVAAARCHEVAIGALELRHEQALSRIEALEAEVAALTAA